MAYGVKYRLIFSDVLGFGKKVEILKKDYTGEVLPIIGGADPVTIKWNSKDDFYSPIIGSQCTLNLMVTDNVQYDEFYKFDEREYKVKISYSKSIPQAYADRVLADGGIYESLECITDLTGNFYTDSTYYENRVNIDGGIVESIDCVSESINDNTFYIWEDYWVGWLVVDRFIEKMTTTPYSIRFNAFDGLGTLSNYDAPLSEYNQSPIYLGLTDLQRIYKILDNLDLDLDIVFLNDLYFLEPDDSGETNKFPNSVTFEKENSELNNGLGLYTAKKQLELLLSLYNMRIYQSFGKWYVVQVTNNFDTSVKNKIVELNYFDNAPQNIRELITLRLKSLHNEFILSNRFDYTGNFIGDENIATVYNVPTQMIPLKNNLTREYLQPLQSVTKVLKTTQFDKSFYNSNPGFEYDLNGWTVTSNRAIIANNEFDLSGAKSIYLNASTTGDLECISSNQPSQLIWNSVFSDIKYIFSFYIDSTVFNLGMNVRFQIYSQGQNQSVPDLYFNSDANKWQSAAIINSIENFKNNQFVNISKTLKSPFDDGFGAENDRRYLQIKIFNTTPGQTGTGYIRTYFDNVGFSQDSSIFGSFSNNKQSGETSVIASRTTNNLFSSNKSIDSILAPGIGSISHWFRSRDKFLFQGENRYNTISNISNQSIMNDFRDFCVRYSGTFRAKTATPLSMINKLWFNWSNTLEDEEASILDEIKYSVKSGEYDVKLHTPNNDNDLTINTRINN